jgi:hypothetical protein
MSQPFRSLASCSDWYAELGDRRGLIFRGFIERGGEWIGFIQLQNVTSYLIWIVAFCPIVYQLTIPSKGVRRPGVGGPTKPSLPDNT